MPITKYQFENAKSGDGFKAFGGKVWKVKRPLNGSILTVQTNKGILHYSSEGIQDAGFKIIPGLSHTDAEFLPQCQWVV